MIGRRRIESKVKPGSILSVFAFAKVKRGIMAASTGSGGVV
ncbi:MAG: hypothetical protein VX780_03110 [Pseudomonadota bacterium]|nr:hypothetical protein [Pseudomonadota bacterium]